MHTATDNPETHIIVGVTGASGSIYGLRALELLQEMHIQTHLVMTDPAKVTAQQELGQSLAEFEAHAAYVHTVSDIAAPIASGSYPVYGMMVVPCSMHTLSAIANSHSDNLLVRAADVTLKEGRPLLLAVRETPLHVGHLRLLVRAAELGAVIFPPVPAFYAHPTTLEDIVTQSVGRMLARLGLPNTWYTRWKGPATSEDV